MQGAASPGTINTIMGEHFHNASGSLDLDMFSNLTVVSGSNHHASPAIANMNTTTTSMGGDDGHNLVVVGILIALIVLLCLFLALVAIPPMCAIWKSSMPVNPQKVERRYRTIEGWLISKIIHKHDDQCDRAQRVYAENREHQRQQPCISSPPPVEPCHSTDETVDSNSSAPCCGLEGACETPNSKNQDLKEVDMMVSSSEEHECPICMEPFLAGQTASWSASNSCEHVFHHSCIKEWLLRHIHCPCCREIYLLVDCPQQKKFTSADLQQLAAERKRRYDQTFFCAKEGLVTLHGLPPSPSKAGQSQSELIMTIKSKTKSGVSKSLLASMRANSAVVGETCAPCDPSSSPTLSPFAEESQQQTSNNSMTSSSMETAPVESVTQSQPTNSSVHCNVPFDEVSFSENDSPRTEPSLKPSQLTVNMSIASKTKSPRLVKSIWRGVDEGQEIPSVLMPLSKSLLGEEFDMEEGNSAAVVTQTDSFKENKATSPKVKQRAITLIMGASKGHNGRPESVKPRVAQPFCSENYQNV